MASIQVTIYGLDREAHFAYDFKPTVENPVEEADQALHLAVGDAADWIDKHTPARPVRDNPQA